MSSPFLLNKKQVDWAYEKWAYYTLDEIADALFVSKHCVVRALHRYGYFKKPKGEKLVYGEFEND